MTDLKEEYIHIRTHRFLVEPNEDAEIVNEGMYGAALSTYLEVELNGLGYSGSAVCEDWGYWLGVSHPDDPKAILELAIYCPNRKNENPMEYVVVVTMMRTKRWDWSKFKFVQFENLIAQLQKDVKEILEKAPETQILSISDDMPA